MRDGEGETAKGHRILVSKASAWKPQSGDVISEILGFCAFPPTPHFSGATIHGRQTADPASQRGRIWPVLPGSFPQFPHLQNMDDNEGKSNGMKEVIGR